MKGVDLRNEKQRPMCHCSGSWASATSLREIYVNVLNEPIEFSFPFIRLSNDFSITRRTMLGEPTNKTKRDNLLDHAENHGKGHPWNILLGKHGSRTCMFYHRFKDVRETIQFSKMNSFLIVFCLNTMLEIFYTPDEMRMNREVIIFVVDKL